MKDLPDTGQALHKNLGFTVVAALWLGIRGNTVAQLGLRRAARLGSIR